MEKLGINLGTFLFYLLNFGALVVVLGAWIYKPLVKNLEERQKRIEQGLDNARIAVEARMKAESDAQHLLGLAKQEAAQQLREATENAQKAAEEVRAEAEKEVAEMRETARTELQAERNRMLADLRGKVAAVAIAAAQKLVGEALDERRQRALIDEFFSGVHSGKVVLLEEGHELPSAATAEVVSALPLTDSEQKTIRTEVGRKAGADIPVAFEVDPELLGGLKIRIGDRMIDGSVASRIGSLRKKML